MRAYTQFMRLFSFRIRFSSPSPANVFVFHRHSTSIRAVSAVHGFQRTRQCDNDDGILFAIENNFTVIEMMVRQRNGASKRIANECVANDDVLLFLLFTHCRQTRTTGHRNPSTMSTRNEWTECSAVKCLERIYHRTVSKFFVLECGARRQSDGSYSNGMSVNVVYEYDSIQHSCYVKKEKRNGVGFMCPKSTVRMYVSFCRIFIMNCWTNSTTGSIRIVAYLLKDCVRYTTVLSSSSRTFLSLMCRCVFDHRCRVRTIRQFMMFPNSVVHGKWKLFERKRKWQWHSIVGLLFAFGNWQNTRLISTRKHNGWTKIKSTIFLS